MHTLGKRVSELERHATASDSTEIRFIRFVGMGQEHLPITRAVCSSLEVIRVSGETDEQFDARIKSEVEAAYPNRRGPHLVFTYCATSRAEAA